MSYRKLLTRSLESMSISKLEIFMSKKERLVKKYIKLLNRRGSRNPKYENSKLQFLAEGYFLAKQELERRQAKENDLKPKRTAELERLNPQGRRKTRLAVAASLTRDTDQEINERFAHVLEK
jgi:hypothetical protein